MKVRSLILPISAVISVASSQLLLQRPNVLPNRISTNPDRDMSPITSKTQQVPLADLLGRNQRIQIYASLTREVDSASELLENPSKSIVVLAPENAAIQRLPRKPWEDSGDYKVFGADAYEGEAGQGRADSNLKKFVESHIISKADWKEGEKVPTVAGNEIWWEKKDDKTFVQPGDVEVLEVGDKAENGEIWILKEILNYPRD